MMLMLQGLGSCDYVARLLLNMGPVRDVGGTDQTVNIFYPTFVSNDTPSPTPFLYTRTNIQTNLSNTVDQ